MTPTATQSNEQALLGAIVRGLFVGATLGVVVKFVTDKTNLKYAASGAAIGAVVFGATYLIKK